MAEDSLDALLRRTALIVAQLAETALHHSERLDRLEALLTDQGKIAERQEGINERLTAAIERLDVTQARIETLLARMLPTGENGRDA